MMNLKATCFILEVKRTHALWVQAIFNKKICRSFKGTLMQI